jgi:nucleolar complex protein 3
MAEPAAKKRRLSPPGDGGGSGFGFASHDLEADYAQRLAKKKQKDKKKDRLLIKTADGRIAENPRVAIEERQDNEHDEDADSFLASEGEDGDSGVVADLQPPKPKVHKPVLPPKEQIRMAKEDLARLAQSISEDPEEHIGQLGALAELARSDNVTVKKLALATQLAVFKDIIPGYRIRPMSEKDLQGKISKDVKRLRNFEQGLLSGYKDYLSTLSKLAVAKASKRLDQKAASGLATVALSCASTLLTSVPHFNNRGDLIGIIIKKLAARKVDADFARCREALEKLFVEDEEGHASLDAVAQLTKMMRGKNYSVHESVLNTFLHLRLLSEFSGKAAPNRIDKAADDEEGAKKPKFKKEFRTKRERKVMRERKQVEKEMKVADAAVSYEERDKNQSETLKLVFVAYFRILKERVPHLMGAVLEGLAKYSHLINQDFFGDILEVLKDLINEAEAALQPREDDEGDDDDDDELDEAEQRNATRESLLAIITAFALLQGQIDVVKSANSLSLDLSFFIRHLYRTLIPLTMNLDIELGAKPAHLSDPNGLHVPSTSSSSRGNKVNVATTAVLLLRSLQSVLLPPINTKSVPPVRVAAFVKQLESLSLHLPPKSAIAVQELLKTVTKVHGTKVAALWHTEERRGDGVFDAQSREVESANPFASTVWEGELLRLHFDPKIRDAVKAVERNVKEARS